MGACKGESSFSSVHSFSVPKLRGPSEVTVAERGQEAARASVPAAGGTARPRFCLHVVPGLAPAGQGLSVLRRPHEPGDRRQASDSCRGGAVPPRRACGRPRTRRCTVKRCFSGCELLRAPAADPVPGERPGQDTGSLRSLG